MPRQVLLVNGSLLTCWPRRPRATAVLIRDDRVVAVGDGPRLYRRLAAEGERPQVLDLQGHTVVPGFIDGHLHLLAYGLSRSTLDLTGSRSLEEMLERVRVHAQALPPDGWVVGRGWDEANFTGCRYPHPEELDRAASGRPCALWRACGSIVVASSRALALAGIDPGRSDGVLQDCSARMVATLLPVPDRDGKLRSLRHAAAEALAAGLTSIRVDDVPAAGSLAEACRLYREVVGAHGVPLRVTLDVSDWALDELSASGPEPEDEWFRLGAVKIYGDGSLGARTAALSEPYGDAPEEWGITITAGEQLEHVVARAHRSGRQVAVHTIGDRAVAGALAAIRQALRSSPRPDHRHRLIHCQVMTPALMRKMAELGTIAEIQPAFVASDQRWAERRLGPERVRHAYAWRSMLAAGVRLSGSSDAPVEPLDPVFGIHAAVTRQDREGRPPGGWQPQERLTVGQALDLFTRGAAYAGFEEGLKGSLEPGKLADLTVLTADPTRVAPADLRHIRVVMTMVGGRVAFAGGPFTGVAGI